MSNGRSFVLLPDRRRSKIIESLVEFLWRLAPDVAFVVTIAREVKERSDPQNRYLWGVCYKLLADATGHSTNDWHAYFCGEFFGWKERQLPGGRRESVPRRTTTTDEDGKRSVMSAADFSEFIELIRSEAAGVPVFIPDADPTVLEAARWGS